MCFSASASFGVGLALMPAGAYCVRTGIRKNLSYLPLSVVPLVFGVQQFGEGLVWLGLDGGNTPLVRIASLFFLFFAISFWPVWLPFSVIFIETRTAVKFGLGGMALLGLAWTGLLYLPILLDPDQWLTTEVACHSVRYDYSRLPVYAILSPETARLLYSLPVFVSLIVSSNGRGRIFGLLLGAAAAASELIFWYAFVSVWCFFAALLALYLCFVFWRLPERASKTGPGVALAAGVFLRGSA